MPHTKLIVTIPEETWIHGVSTAHPDIEFTVVATLAGETTGIALLECTASNGSEVLVDIERREDVTDLDLLWTHDDELLLQVETEAPVLLTPVWRTGVLPQTPFVVRDGEVTWELTTTSGRLSRLGDRLADAEIRFDIEYVRTFGTDFASHLLTDRQRQLVLAAFERGYYATPRTATLTEVAESVGISKATASDTLHRAEGRIIDWFIGEHVTNHSGADRPLD
ncbi:helix-turn-helix domain-containing protein [Haladaptatus paucihalophilus]|nr:helix-turn-helix domain-containing protein [Haladaptatus paucihalophilus]